MALVLILNRSLSPKQLRDMPFWKGTPFYDSYGIGHREGNGMGEAFVIDHRLYNRYGMGPVHLSEYGRNTDTYSGYGLGETGCYGHHQSCDGDGQGDFTRRDLLDMLLDATNNGDG